MANHRLWAPWRLQYLTGDKTDECIFCTRPAMGDDERTLIVHRGDSCYVMLNAYPYTNGHVMVAPYDHVADLRALDAGAAAEFMDLTQRSLAAVEQVYSPEGFNLGVNMGAVAGAGFAEHVHQHVVPRWKGDTSFMPVVGDTLVLPEVLPDSWARLRQAFAEAP
ncbi:MAG TPA: HIT domain-containing protein [Solirubrobacterales bacterium]|nr:HIT domain-containing protein [Solirubrobacterales bacterium]